MPDASSIQLTPSQETGLHALQNTTANIFLTGGPGTGKSFLIQEYLKRADTEIPVVASTGAAAILVGGRTFHSFFSLGILQGGADQVIEKAVKNSGLRSRLRNLKTLVIDEISMLSREAFDTAERIARQVRHSDLPWGGVRMIAAGDFAQLPPISPDRDKSWCFRAAAWRRSNFQKVVLREVKRTEDAEFLEVLEEIRWGRVTERVRAFLNSRVMLAEEIEADVPHLFPRRAQTDAFNKNRLEQIHEPLRAFETEYEGDPYGIERLKRDAPVSALLELKKGALVMMRVNDPRQRFINGTVGHVLEVQDDAIYVEARGRRLEIEPFTFSWLNADGEEAAMARNFPVSLAYASTIHKIQGTTLERLHADLNALWEPGQAYVALSRARNAAALTLARWGESSIKADPVVQAFYEDRLEDLPEEGIDYQTEMFQ